MNMVQYGGDRFHSCVWRWGRPLPRLQFWSGMSVLVLAVYYIRYQSVVLWLWCVCRKNCLFCVLISVRDGERLGVSGCARVSAVFFLRVCACARQCCLIHVICFGTSPRTLNGAPCHLPITCPVLHHFLHECDLPANFPCWGNWLVRDTMLDHVLK